MRRMAVVLVMAALIGRRCCSRYGHRVARPGG